MLENGVKKIKQGCFCNFWDLYIYFNKNYKLLILILCKSRKAVYFVALIEKKHAKLPLRLLNLVSQTRTFVSSQRFKNLCSTMMSCISRKWWAVHHWIKNKTRDMSLIDSSLLGELLATGLRSLEKILPMRLKRNRSEDWK